MAYFDTTWYCNFGDGSTTGYYAVTKRPQNAAVAAGQLVRQFTAPSAGNERVFVCTTAGTTANTTDATWTLTRGARVTDGTAVWVEVTGITAVNGDLANTLTWDSIKSLTISPGAIVKRANGASYQINATGGNNPATASAEPAFSDTAGVTTSVGGGVWTSLGPVANFTGGQAPHARLNSVLAANWFSSGNTVYVGDNHAETQSGNMTLSPTSTPIASILCHNHSGSYPPTASNIMTGATITTQTTSFLNFDARGSFYVYGLTFRSGNGGTLGAGSVAQTQNWYYFDNCSWQFGAGGGASTAGIGATSTAWGVIVFNNTTMKFGAATGCLIPYFTQFVWQNTGQILASGSAVPTTLFQLTSSSGRFSTITLRNLDLSQLTGSLFTNASNSSIGSLIVQDCKLNAAMTVTTPINSGMNVQLIRSDSAATAYKSTRYQYEGTETTETSIVRTGGAVDPNGQAQARKIVTTANAQWLRPFKAEPMAIWNETVGSAVTATVCGTVNAGALPNNDDIWLETEYLGSATDPKGTIVTTTKSNVLASNAAVTSDSSVWPTSLAPSGLTGLIGWWDASVASSLTLSGSDILSVADQSGGGRTMNWANAKPQYNATGFNTTKPAIVITTGGQSLEATGFPMGTGNTLTVWIVTTMGTTGTNNNGRWLSFRDPARGPDWAYNEHWALGRRNNAARCDFVRNFTDTESAVVAVHPAPHRIIVTVTSAGAITVYVDGVVSGTGTRSGNWANGTLTIGRETTNGEAMVAPIAECGVATSYNDVDTVVRLDAYLAAKWGMTPLTSFVPFKLASTITPQLPGYIHARVRVGKASATYYVDPKIVIT